MPRRWPEALDDAACRGLPPQVFDGKTHEDVNAALATCHGCRCKRACNLWMRPGRTFYDGIAAGRLWRDGKAVEPVPQPVE